MNRMLMGALAALALAGAGVFWWQGRAQTETGAPPPELEEGPDAPGGPDTLPSASVAGLRGPEPPVATELSKEQRRFARYDRNRDGRITRNEMMATRTQAFRKLDTDGNNLLTFEEWAIATSDRFSAVDANGDGWLGPQEFLATRPRDKPKPKCRC